jgi:hypothetical protein
LKRASNSTDFGFTIVGYCPCQIGRVETNSIAYKAGLQYGDQIIKIDAENVSRATSESIVKLIKYVNVAVDDLALIQIKNLSIVRKKGIPMNV